MKIFNNDTFSFLFILCVICLRISLISNSFYNIELCYKIKGYPYLLFKSWPENQSASLPYSGARPPWR